MKDIIKDIGTLKGIDKLTKSFDNVIHENLEDYQTLELSNNVINRNTIEKVVYLKLNISYSGSGGRKPKDCLEGAINDLLPWLDLLLNHDEKDLKTQTKQLSLFDEEIATGIEYEVEPEMPTSEGNWDKYFKDCHKVRINNLKKDYSFFDLFNPLAWWWSYHFFEYKKFVPNLDSLLLLLKDAILKYKDIGGRHHDVWFDNPSCISKKPLSDVELYTRVMGCIRLFVAPWPEFSPVFFDDSYTKHSDKSSRVTHLFYFDGKSLVLNYSSLRNFINKSNSKEFGLLKDEIASYNFYTPEFISFLRETFHTPFKEPLDDISSKELMLKSFASSLNPKWENILNSSNSFKDFKSKLLQNVDVRKIEFKNEWLSEDYHFVMSIDKNTPYLRIEQKTHVRILLGYDFDANTDLSNWKYVVENIEGDAVYKQIYNKYRTSASLNIIQTSLFDFLGAA